MASGKEADVEKATVPEASLISNPPPSYQTVAEEPPPAYNTLFGEIREAHRESANPLSFMKTVCLILGGTIGVTVILALCLAIPIASIVIGAKYKNDCPVQSMIPIYLIVLGAFGIVRNLSGLSGRRHDKSSRDSEDQSGGAKAKSGCDGIIDCFLFAWFIAGNVWVYTNYQPEYHDTTSSQYCHEVLYKFAFWLTTATYIIMAGVCCVACTIGCCAVFCQTIFE